MSDPHVFTPEEVAKRIADAEANRIIPLDEFLQRRSTVKVYLAAPYQWKDKINQYAVELRKGGVCITSSWLNEPHKPTTQMGELTHEQHQVYAKTDVKDVLTADILVFFTEPTKTIVRAGRHVEFGMVVGANAVRRQKVPIYVVGEEMENIFHHLPGVVHFKSWEPLRDLLIAITSNDKTIAFA